MGQAVFACFKASVAWRDWKTPESPPSGYRVQVEIRRWGILNVKYYWDPQNLKTVHFKQYHRVKCSRTVWKYDVELQVLKPLPLDRNRSVGTMHIWFTMDESKWMSDVSFKFVELDCNTALLCLALFCQINVNFHLSFPVWSNRSVIAVCTEWKSRVCDYWMTVTFVQTLANCTAPYCLSGESYTVNTTSPTNEIRGTMLSLKFLGQQRNSPHFVEPEGSLPCSQELATCPSPGSYEFCPSILILFLTE